MKQKFYYPICYQVQMLIESMSTEQFLSVFQGLTLTGASVFQPELLNQILNSFVERLPTLTFDDVIAFLELFVKFSRQVLHESKVGDTVDKQALIDLVNENYFSHRTSQLDMSQITSLFWVFNSLQTEWSGSLLQ